MFFFLVVPGPTASVGMYPQPCLESDWPKGYAKINKVHISFGGWVKRHDLVCCTDRTKKKRPENKPKTHFIGKTHPWKMQKQINYDSAIIIIIRQSDRV